MIPLKEAQEQNFSKSTRAELLAYAQQLGVENIPEKATAAMLKKAVASALGIAIDVEGRPAPSPIVTATSGGDKIFPSYNLSPNGIWGGRRHRLSIPRPEGSKYAAAEGFGWNGKHTYYIAYDEVDAVPEPIYNIIVQNKRRRAKSERPIGGEQGEQTTVWEFDNVPLAYYGVDEETKNRAGSMLEWYQSRGSDWYATLTERHMQQVAIKLEVGQTVAQGEKLPPRVRTPDELRVAVMEFLFGYADAQVEPRPEIEA